jgi:hypothetical protein
MVDGPALYDDATAQLDARIAAATGGNIALSAQMAVKAAKMKPIAIC